MTAPDRIYLQVCGDCTAADCESCKFEDLEDNVTWCKDRIFERDVEYIRKDAILDWLKARIAVKKTILEQAVVQATIEKIESLK